MERVAFVMQLHPEAGEEYRRRHQHIWPALSETLSKAGAHNYSIFIHGSSLIAYLEVDDLARYRSTTMQSDVVDRWEKEMLLLIDPMIDPSTGFHVQLE